MNIILLDPSELPAPGEVQLDDHRADHLRKVLRVKPGDRVRLGVVDGHVGVGEVLALEGRRVSLRCR